MVRIIQMILFVFQQLLLDDIVNGPDDSHENFGSDTNILTGYVLVFHLSSSCLWILPLSRP